MLSLRLLLPRRESKARATHCVYFFLTFEAAAFARRALFSASAFQIRKLNNIAAGQSFVSHHTRSYVIKYRRAVHTTPGGSFANLTCTYAKLKHAKLPPRSRDVSFNRDLMSIINPTAATYGQGGEGATEGTLKY